MNLHRRPITLILELLLIAVGIVLLHCGPAPTSTPMPGGQKTDAGAATLPDVFAPPGATAVSIDVTPTGARLSPGELVHFTAVVTWSDGSTTDVSSYATFASSDPSVLWISAGGHGAAVKAGTATVSASAEGQSITTSVTVAEAALTGLSLNVSGGVLAPGRTQQLAVTATFSDGSTRDVTQSATFASSNPSVAEVSATGVVLARARGGATIEATYGHRIAESHFTVTDADLVSIQVTPAAASLTIGATQNFSATANYADGSSRNVTAESAWVSGNTETATVSASGLVTARASGSVTITATHGGKVGTATLIVQSPRIVTLTVSPANTTVTKADEQQFAATATYSNGLSANVTSSVTWSTSDPTVGTIDAAGKFTAIKVGATQVHATLGGMTNYTSVTVVAPTVVSLSVSPSVATVGVGATVALTATAKLTNGTTENVTSACQWSSLATSVATVASGTVTGAGAGSTTITCTLQGRSAQATVTVTASSLTVGGTVTGLVSYNLNDMPLGLRLNGGPTLWIHAITQISLWPGFMLNPTPVPFTFPTTLASGAEYTITVEQQPTGRYCSVTTGATGRMGTSNVTDVVVSCGNPPQPNYRILFLSAAKTAGNIGITDQAAIDNADFLCQIDTNKPVGSTSTYKAVLVSNFRQACFTGLCTNGPSEHLDWVLEPNREYRREDGLTVIGTTNANGIFASFPLSNSVGAAFNNAWTGLAVDWTTSMNCAGWIGMFGLASAGVTDATGASAFGGGAFPACSGQLPLYCAEQTDSN